MTAAPKEIATGVFWMPIAGTNVYFLRSASSWVLIDTAWANRGRLIKRIAASLFGADTRPVAILLTHLHPDHAGSALELARLWSLSVYVHPDELPPAEVKYPARLMNPLGRWVIEPLLGLLPKRAHGSTLRDVLRALGPSAGVPGLRDWTCIHTPGHTPGHIALFRSSDRVLIAGDAILTLNVNSVWGLLLQTPRVSAPPYISTWNWAAAKASVAALAKLEPNVLACGHGVPMTGPKVADELHSLSDRLQVPPR